MMRRYLALRAIVERGVVVRAGQYLDADDIGDVAWVESLISRGLLALVPVQAQRPHPARGDVPIDEVAIEPLHEDVATVPDVGFAGRGRVL